MNKLNYLFMAIIGSILTFGTFSCSKENNTIDIKSKDSLVSSRDSPSACSPQSMFTEYSSCNDQNINQPISFSASVVFDINSTIYQLCPNLQLNVNYILTTCTIGSLGATVHFIHNLNYDINAMIASCPALGTEIQNQQTQGTLVSFLDLIDKEISIQIELNEAIKDIKNHTLLYYDCEEGRNFYSVKYIKNTCYRWNTLFNPNETGPKYYIVKQDCGNSVCCVRSTDYCVLAWENGEPVLVVSSPSNYQKTEGTCEEDCFHDCGGIEPGMD